MPTYNISLPATTTTPQFVCNVPTNATGVTITQSGGGLWNNGSSPSYFWYPQGSPYPTPGANPSIAPTAVDTDWTTGGQTITNWSVYWTGTAVAGSTPVPFATIYLAVPQGSGTPATPYHADTSGNWYRPNTGPTTYTITGGTATPNSSIKGGYDLYVLPVNDAIAAFADNTGTLTATVVVTVPEPPAVPTLSAVAGCIGGQASLSWTSSLGSGATGYKLYLGGSLYQTFSGETLTFTDTGLTTGTTYSYQVTAVGTGGESDRSTAAVVTPCLHPPQGLAWATGGACEGGQASLSWVLSDSVGTYLTAGQTTQNVYQGGVKVASGIDGTALSHLVASLTVGTPYTFALSLTDQWGNESAPSTAITITPCVDADCCNWVAVNAPPAGNWVQVNGPCQ